MALKHGIVAVLLLGACIAVSAQANDDSTVRGPPRPPTGPPIVRTPVAGPDGSTDPSLPVAAGGDATGPAPLTPGGSSGVPVGPAHVPVFGAPSAPLPKEGPEAPSLRGGLKITAPDDQSDDGISIDVGPEPRFTGTIFDGRTAEEKKAAGPPAPIPPPVVYTIADPAVEPNQLTEPPTLPQKKKPAKFTADPKDVKDNSAPKDAAPKDAAAKKDAAPKALRR